MKDEEGKGKEKDPRISSDGSNALILSLAESSELWVIDSGASFHATFQQDIFQIYVKGELEKVYLRDDEPCDIVGKGGVVERQCGG